MPKPSKKPRHPVVVIGAGIAGLAAAHILAKHGIPHLVLERFSRPGGRVNSRTGEGWIADHGTRFILRSDEILGNLIRQVGMEDHRVSIQGGVHLLKADRSIEVPRNGGVDLNRLCLDTGFAEMTRRLANQVEVRFQTAVSAIRWDNDRKSFWWEKEGQVFWFEDDNGLPLRHQESRELILASGVILATTPTAATVIARNSRSLEKVVPLLNSIQYSSTFTGIFKLPRVRAPFYALEGEPGANIAWMSFEEAKAPERVDPGYSLLLVDAAPRWSHDLMSLPETDALSVLYNEARRVLPDLPEVPVSRTYKRWNVSRPETEPLGIPRIDGQLRWPTNPDTAPFALAGDYILGPRAEDAARSGMIAAEMVIEQIPGRKSFLGLEFQ